MSQRASGLRRKVMDLYPTPSWVIDALVEHLAVHGLLICDPCAGVGHVSRALFSHGAKVRSADIKRYSKFPDYLNFAIRDFLKNPPRDMDGWVINPPYGPQGHLAEAFIRQAIVLLRKASGPSWAAILLPVDFDSAITRVGLFEECPLFAAKIVLRRRIEWFKRAKGKSGPSQNHAWFIYSTVHPRAPGSLPVTVYGPNAQTVLGW